MSWQIDETGFLLSPQPLTILAGLPAGAAEQIAALLAGLHDAIADGSIRKRIEALPVYDLTPLRDADHRTQEKAFVDYAYLASAYIHTPDQEAARRLPRSIARPLAQLGDMTQRPPILSYALMTLANWQKIDPDGDIVPENLALPLTFIPDRDAEWFTIIHVAIEATAGKALHRLPALFEAIREDHDARIVEILHLIATTLQEMQALLKRMPEECHPVTYYHRVRPFMFGFDTVVFEGAFDDEPQTLRGETGAQSSIVPAFIRALGVGHQESNLTRYLQEMQVYMPAPHREFLAGIDTTALRAYLLSTSWGEMHDAYHAALEELLAFRQLHLRFAMSYIANQSPETRGTGGTDFMRWLQQLIDETAAHRLAH